MLRIIGGKFKTRVLITSKAAGLRPTTSQLREAFFNICRHEIENSSFLDLFAGSGAMGLEALSRGANEVVFAERERSSLAALRKNISTLGVEEQTQVLAMDVRKALQLLVSKGAQFDLIYADPPYGLNLGAMVVECVESHALLKEGGYLFIEDTALTIPPLENLVLLKERQLGKGRLYELTLRRQWSM